MADVNRELDEFLGERLTAEWIAANIRPAVHEYDVAALQKSLFQPVHEFLASGGKRWRPTLMNLCAEAVGGNCPDRLLLIPELLHNGTLMVDDVEDGSGLRRGEPATHVKFGIAMAVNAGNYLYFLPLRLLQNAEIDAGLKQQLYGDVIQVMTELHLGQGTDIAWSHGLGAPNEERYFEMCRNKTGSMARLAARMGARIGGGSEEQITALGEFATEFGIAFQIMDDLKNITGGLGKEFGDDIKEGKRSLPAIYALETSAERAELQSILDLKEPRVEVAIGIIQRSGAMERAQKKADEVLENAWKKADAVLEESAAKQELRALLEKLR